MSKQQYIIDTAKNEESYCYANLCIDF